MTQTFTAVFDGQFFHPETPLKLQPNMRYLFTIQDMPAPAIEGDAWVVLESLIGTVIAPPEWSNPMNDRLLDLQ